MKELRQKRFHYTYSPKIEPEMVVEPGEKVLVETQDCINNFPATEDGVFPPPPHTPLSGPIYVKGCSKGDVLEVVIEEIEITRGKGWMGQTGEWGTCMSGSETTPVLNDPIPTRMKICKIEEEVVYFPTIDGRMIPLPASPMIGAIGTAPEVETQSFMQGRFGGNMDAPDVCKGSRLRLPVFAEGALLYLGDVHAIQGDGESSSPVEVSSETTLTLNVIKGKTIHWPRIETVEYIETVGITRPLDDAFRVASTEMVKWLMEDYGFEKWDANLFMGLVDKVQINQCANPLYCLSLKVPKRLLPERR
ncbi:MAG: acetamidase/formamidase family protein [Candidatus Bathyarchaeia archaeon]